MNIAMEQTEEYVNGSVTNRYGDTFIRGNNGAYLASVALTDSRISNSAVYLCCGTSVMKLGPQRPIEISLLIALGSEYVVF
jgi:hypothetical protein